MPHHEMDVDAVGLTAHTARLLGSGHRLDGAGTVARHSPANCERFRSGDPLIAMAVLHRVGLARSTERE